MNSNICFFVRNNNDIDNIVPVAWKCAQCDVNVNIIILTHHGYKRDFRILYLSKNKNVKVYHIIDFLNVNSIEKVRIVNRTLKNISPDEVNSPCVWSSYIDNNIFYQNIIAKIFDNGKNCLACFDSVSPFVRNLSKKLNKFEVPVVLLPHGVYPFVNLFISKDMIKPRNSEEIVKNSIFDYVILPNENELKMTCSSYQSNQVKVLGSARFCNEWREIFFISQSVNLGFGRNAKLKVAFFLRDWGYAINWEEVERTFRLITQFSEVHLIVKHHPRSIGQKNLRSKYPFLFIEKSSNITGALGVCPSRLRSEP